jgi:cyclase
MTLPVPRAAADGLWYRAGYGVRAMPRLKSRKGIAAMRRFALLALLLCATFGSGGSACAITGEAAELEKLADGVYAFIGKRNDANAMVIVTTQGVVLVDTGNNPPETRILQKLVESVTNQPVRYIVVSQNHGDHVGGVPLFSPPANVIAHERVLKDWEKWKPFQVKAWRKRFGERSAALANVNPADTILTFNDRMTLHLGGTTIELIYVDDRYNPGDVAVWLPGSGVLHAAFVGYITRHPDIRPDYSHGTTSGMLKQLEVLIALKPKIVVPAHGPLGDVTDLQALTDYLLTARQTVRAMMSRGLSLAEIEKQFTMSQYQGWDRDSHFPWMAETIYRELRGQDPLIVPMAEKTVKATISKLAEEGRFLTVSTDAGEEVRLRISTETDFEGIADRSALRIGMKVRALYQVPQGANAALGYDVEELDVEP